MNKTKLLSRMKSASTYVLLSFLLAGCSTNTPQYFSKSSVKMAHHTTILNYQTHRVAETIPKGSSDVNFEYEEIITQ